MRAPAFDLPLRLVDVSVHAGALPILVGGTGLYIRTLLDGIAPVPPIEPTVRETVRALPVEDAYAALQAEDPERATVLNRNDTSRIARSLEVVRSTGRSLSYWQRERVGGIGDAIDLIPRVLMPDRAWLFGRCDLRFERMWGNGAVAEVEALLARGLGPDLPVMRAIGVPQIKAWLNGEVSQLEAKADAKHATRMYAKRQNTWFRQQAWKDWPWVSNEHYDLETMFETLFRF